MIKLDPPFDKAFYDIFKPLNYNLATISVLKGLTCSKVYTDSLNPSWAVTSSNNRIFVTGNYMKLGVKKAIQLIIKKGADIGNKGFLIYYPPRSRDKEIGKHIVGVKSYPNWRNYFTLELDTPFNTIELLEGYRIEQITEKFLEKRYANIEQVKKEMLSERSDLDDFLNKSFGFCMLYNEVIVSWCMSEYNVDRRFEIGIETQTNHRQKGLAVQIAKACINHGIEEGYKYVGWHCWKKNVASNKTALSIGFRYILEYPVEYLEVI